MTATSAIEERNRQFEDAIARGDAAGVAAVYTETGSVLPSNAPRASGRPAIEQFWGGIIASGVKRATLDTLELDVLGDTALEVGAYELMVSAEDGGVITADRGKFVVVWKREGDEWRWAVDIFNSDLPVAG